MTIKRWDGEQWRSVGKVGRPTKDALVKVRRSDSWELIWPPNITHVAVADGNWTDQNTWMDGAVPTDGAGVLIRSDVTVTVDQAVSTRLKSMRVAGTYRVDPTVDTLLRVETIVVPLGGRFELGTEANPVQQGVTTRLEFIDEGPIDESADPDRVTKGLLVTGDLEIVGAEKTAWSTLSSPPQAGENSITLSSAPTNWNVGDTIVIPGLEAYSTTNLDHRDEERTIASVNNDTIGLDSALEYDHVPPETDLDTYALNLSRNVQFYSENTTIDRRGHFMVMATETTIKYLETRDMGRTDKSRDVTSPLWGRGEADPSTPPNPRARYSLHFHRTGPTEPAHVVRGCVVRRDPGWGYVNHSSHAQIEDCISYDVFGAGFVAENGNEVGTFKRNFALRSRGSGEHTETRKGWRNAHPNRMAPAPHNIDDLGHSGHGFWFQSPLVEVEGNVAAGHRHTGFTFWTRALYEQVLGSNEALDGKHDMFPLVPAEVLTDYELRVGRSGDEDPPVGDSWHEKDPSLYFTDSLPLRSFQNNVAFGLGGAAFDLRGGLMFRNDASQLDRYEHKNNVAYHISPLIQADGSEHHQENFTSSGNVGLDHRYVGNVIARGYRLIGDGDGYGVYRNHAYLDDLHVKDTEIRNWGVGLIPPDYGGKLNECDVENVTFAENDIDIEIDGQMGGRNGGPLELKNNQYSGTKTLHHNEIPTNSAIPERFVGPPIRHSRIRYEGRTVYHGWCDPDFVFVQEGDDQRLNEVLNHGNGDRWQEQILNGDDPYTVLPGLTHQDLYDQYGAMFYGGMRDPDAADSERPAEFSGSGGSYDSTPFLGPANKSQPTDEIWVDVVNHCSFEGDYQIIQYGDGVEREEPIQLAHDQTVVQLNRLDDRDWDLPVREGTGIASYTFEVDRTGTYQVHVRAQQGESNGGTGSGDNNSQFYVRMDGGTWKNMDGNNGLVPGNDLVWPSAEGDMSSNLTQHDLASGQHTIEVAGKGSGMRLDWLLIKHETVGAIPYGLGKPHTP